MTTTYLLNAPGSVVEEFLPPHPNVLRCNFAVGDFHPTIINRLKAWQLGQRLADLNEFTDQVRRCDMLVLGGGSSPLLIAALQVNPEWMEHLDGKVVLAYSAGISALAEYSYNRDGLGIIQGLGLIPYQTVVHFREGKDSPDWDMVDALRSAHPDIQVRVIPDNGYYKVHMEYTDD